MMFYVAKASLSAVGLKVIDKAQPQALGLRETTAPTGGANDFCCSQVSSQITLILLSGLSKSQMPAFVNPVAGPPALPGSESTRRRTSAMERAPHLAAHYGTHKQGWLWEDKPTARRQVARYRRTLPFNVQSKQMSCNSFARGHVGAQ